MISSEQFLASQVHPPLTNPQLIPPPPHQPFSCIPSLCSTKQCFNHGFYILHVHGLEEARQVHLSSWREAATIMPPGQCAAHCTHLPVDMAGHVLFLVPMSHSSSCLPDGWLLRYNYHQQWHRTQISTFSKWHISTSLGCLVCLPPRRRSTAARDHLKKSA